MVLKEEEVFVTSRKNGQCSKGDQCSFRHESNDRAKPTPKAEPPSEPQSSKTRGRSVSRKMPEAEASNRPSCKYFLKGSCTNSPCEISLNRDVNSAQSAHSRTVRLKNNQTKSRKKVIYCEKCATVELCITGY